MKILRIWKRHDSIVELIEKDIEIDGVREFDGYKMVIAGFEHDIPTELAEAILEETKGGLV